jgi:hypothetical protein
MTQQLVLASNGVRTGRLHLGAPVLAFVRGPGNDCAVLLQRQDGVELLHLRVDGGAASSSPSSAVITVSAAAALRVPLHRCQHAGATAAAAVALLPAAAACSSNGQQQERRCTCSATLLALAAPMELLAIGTSSGGLQVSRAERSTSPASSGRRRRQLRSLALGADRQQRGVSAGRYAASSCTAANAADGAADMGVAVYSVGSCVVHSDASKSGAGTLCAAAAAAAPHLLQHLPTAQAVTSLAVCERARLLGAAGAAGSACVWHLAPQLQQHHGHQQLQPVDADSCVLLPQAQYHGISLPDMVQLSFLLQPRQQQQQQQRQQSRQWQCAATAKEGPRLPPRVLLLGCCSRGSVAVWDVGRRQLVAAVHSPGLLLQAVMPLQPPLSEDDVLAAAAAAAAAPKDSTASPAAASSTAAAQQRRKGRSGADVPDLIGLLALVAARPGNTSGPEGPEAAGATGTCLTLPQPGGLQLRPLLLHPPGTLLQGASMLESAHDGAAQAETTAIAAAALCGTTVAVAGHSGLVKAWDVISGMTHFASLPAGSDAGCRGAAVPLTAAQLLMVQRPQHGTPALQQVLLLGDAGGILTAVLL